MYNSLLTEESFYSPVLDEKGQYDVELTEVIDGQTTNYKRIVCVKEDAEMPSYVTNPSENNNDIVLVPIQMIYDVVKLPMMMGKSL